MRKTSIFVMLLVISLTSYCQEKLSADTIYLKSGEIIIGEITWKTSKSITMTVGTRNLSSSYVIQKEEILRTGITSNIQGIKLSEYKQKNENKSENKSIEVAGNELILYSNHWYTGSVLTICGGLICTGGIILDGNNKKEDTEITKNKDSEGLIIAAIGGIMAIVGIIYTYESVSHVGKAGRILRDNKLTLISDKQYPGIGICYKF